MRAKTDIRIEVLARRRALPPEARVAAAERVQAELARLVRQRRPRRSAGYVPVGSEPGGPALPDVLVAALHATDRPDARLLLPVLQPDLDLDWAPYAGSDSLTAARLGMREPQGVRLGPDAVGTADLVVVPALAVDRSGIRLGRGGGSYDRALSRVDRSALVVALLHDRELVATLPAEPHDRPVDAVITPTEGLVVLRGPD